MATAVLFLAFQDLWHTLIGVSCVAVVLVLVGLLVLGPADKSADGRTVGAARCCATGDRQITIQVTSVDGVKLVGRWPTTATTRSRRGYVRAPSSSTS